MNYVVPVLSQVYIALVPGGRKVVDPTFLPEGAQEIKIHWVYGTRVIPGPCCTKKQQTEVFEMGRCLVGWHGFCAHVILLGYRLSQWIFPGHCMLFLGEVPTKHPNRSLSQQLNSLREGTVCCSSRILSVGAMCAGLTTSPSRFSSSSSSRTWSSMAGIFLVSAWMIFCFQATLLFVSDRPTRVNSKEVGCFVVNRKSLNHRWY